MTLTRSPLKRGVPLKATAFKAPRAQAPANEPKPAPGPRKIRCKVCKSQFLPDAPWIKHCSPDCGAELGQMLVAKQRAKAQRKERAETKAKLAAYATVPQLKARLQAVFNLFIRLRDDGLPCICCGKFPKGDASLSGGQWDACHWKGRGSHDHLRFNEDNVHRGLKDCNKYGHTDYRGGLVAKIGLERVEALESNQALVKWTREGLESQITEYRAKIKQLKKEAS